MMPHLVAIARAVEMLSPVTMRTQSETCRCKEYPQCASCIVGNGSLTFCGSAQTQTTPFGSRGLKSLNTTSESLLHCDWLKYLGAHRVLDAHHGDAGEAGEDVGLVLPVGLSVGGAEVSVSEADGAQPLRRHRLNHSLHQVVLVPGLKGLGLAADGQDLTAPGSTRAARVT
ncbi:hypothetical protein EYF80_043629 [Liparis tanakae]|uniref:Uncharacterized protein n=1 Tax=Liparis tanakae TaxID=230148 RepID=A0A4Z2G0W5_9TELE|nr:hypothetical protein EYF80_043629 [Liparis tanakae]